MRLGWFEHIALAALYDNSAQPVQAQAHRARALGSSRQLWYATGILVLCGVAGVVICLVAAALTLAGRSPFRLTGSVTPLPQQTGRTLLVVAAAYFATLIAIRAAAPLISQIAVGPASLQGAILWRALTMVAASLVAVAVPLALLSALIRRQVLRPAMVGLAAPAPARDVLAGVGGYCAALPWLAVSLLVSSYLFARSSTRLNPAVADFALAEGTAARTVLFFLATIVAPITEEIVFRGILFRGLQSLLGTVPAAVLGAALFALLHPQLPMGFLSIFVLGLLFTGLYAWRGSLWPAIIAHGINNGTVFVYLVLVLGG